jgi:hypothetical protein
MITGKCLQEMQVPQISRVSPQEININKENLKKEDCP